MDLDAQIQQLIEEAPTADGTQDLVRLVAPALRSFAARLQRPDYYIVQTLDQNWAMTQLSHESDPETIKTVIYAFPTLESTTGGPYPMKDPQLIALPLPTTHIIFQMLAFDGIDSLIFFDNPENLAVGTEITRAELHAQVQSLLQQAMPGNAPPPDIA